MGPAENGGARDLQHVLEPEVGHKDRDLLDHQGDARVARLDAARKHASQFLVVGVRFVRAQRSAGGDREIALTADEADQLLVILDDVVVSLDRIGSREASGEDPEHAYIHEYFSTGGATVRLSHVRGILHQAFRRVYTEDEQLAMWDERPWPDWAGYLPEIASKPDDG